MVIEHFVQTSRTQAQAWLGLALLNLLLGSLMALVLVLAKTPSLSQWLGLAGLFPRALVFHVNLTILFWVSCCGAWCWLRCFPGRWAGFDYMALLMAVLAPLLLLMALLGEGQPVLTNYVPLLDSAWFYSGLLLFAGAISLLLFNRTLTLWQTLHSDLFEAKGMLALGALAWWVAIAVLVLSWLNRAPVLPFAAQAEHLLWGFGHLLQAVNLMLLVGGWVYISGYRNSYFFHRLLQWLWLSGLFAALLIAFVWPPASPEYRQLFGYWMRFFSLPVIVLIAIPLLGQVLRQRIGEMKVVALSLGLFAAGVLIGASIRADNLLVPAHYHAVTGALNLVLMLLIYRATRELPALSQRCFRQLYGYALGVIMLVAGLGLSGWMGVGRKLAGEAQGLEGTAQIAAMLLMVAGGVLALVGCFWFLYRLWRLGLHRRRVGSLPSIAAGVP